MVWDQGSAAIDGMSISIAINTSVGVDGDSNTGSHRHRSIAAEPSLGHSGRWWLLLRLLLVRQVPVDIFLCVLEVVYAALQRPNIIT